MKTPAKYALSFIIGTALIASIIAAIAVDHPEHRITRSITLFGILVSAGAAGIASKIARDASKTAQESISVFVRPFVRVEIDDRRRVAARNIGNGSAHSLVFTITHNGKTVAAELETLAVNQVAYVQPPHLPNAEKLGEVEVRMVYADILDEHHERTQML